MALDYQSVADVAKALELINSVYKEAGFPRCYPAFNPEPVGKRSYEVGWGIIYSPQEIKIPGHRSVNDSGYSHRRLPVGVTRILTKSPRKEYISFVDAQGTTRYYLIPEDGIRLRKKNGTYTVTNPIQDYSISVDRAAAKKAREDAEELIEYVTLLWNVLIEAPPYNERPGTTPDIDDMPSADRKEEWFNFLLAAKYPQNGYGWALTTLLQKIRDKCTKDALAYSIEPVPTTRMDHTEHWEMLETLRAAGRLEQFEGRRTSRARNKA